MSTIPGVCCYLNCYKYWFLFVCQMMDYLKKMTGREYVGFSNATWVLNTTSLFLSNYTLRGEPTVCYLICTGDKMFWWYLKLPVRERDRWQELCDWLLSQREKSKSLFVHCHFHKHNDRICIVFLTCCSAFIPVVFSHWSWHDGSPWLLLSGKSAVILTHNCL